MHENEEFSYKLDLLFAYIKQMIKSQQELSEFMHSLSDRLPVAEKKPAFQPVAQFSEWVDAHDAKELIKAGNMTLRRRRLDGTFQAKKIGKKWFYLRSSLQ